MREVLLDLKLASTASRCPTRRMWAPIYVVRTLALCPKKPTACQLGTVNPSGRAELDGFLGVNQRERGVHKRIECRLRYRLLATFWRELGFVPHAGLDEVEKAGSVVVVSAIEAHDLARDGGFAVCTFTFLQTLPEEHRMSIPFAAEGNSTHKDLRRNRPTPATVESDGWRFNVSVLAFFIFLVWRGSSL